MFHPWELVRGMEVVWLAWLAGVGLLLVGARWTLRRFQAPGLRELWRDEGGASYTLSYVLAVPVYLLFICIVAEMTLLLVAKVGTLYAAHAGARSSIVWRS